MSKCEYDSGSMYGNRPLCSAPAKYVVVERSGMGKPFRNLSCEKHRKNFEARAYPMLDHVETL